MKVNIEIADLLLKRFSSAVDMPVWMVRDFGRRRAFVCGTVPELPSAAEPLRLELAGDLALLAQPRGKEVPPKTEERLGDLAAALQPYLRP